MNTVAERFRYARSCAKMSQRDLARRLNISQPVISKWEHHDAWDPQISTVVKLAKVLKVNPTWLAFGRSSS